MYFVHLFCVGLIFFNVQRYKRCLRYRYGNGTRFFRNSVFEKLTIPNYKEQYACMKLSIQCVCKLMFSANRRISFFHLFIATMSNSLQTSFNRVMKDWPDKYHIWGPPPAHPQGQTCDI